MDIPSLPPALTGTHTDPTPTYALRRVTTHLENLEKSGNLSGQGKWKKSGKSQVTLKLIRYVYG